MVKPAGASRKAKSPPIMSQEFFLKNHGDITSCVCIVIMVGLMFNTTQPFAARFISIHYNVTENVTAENEVEHQQTLYHSGPIDLFNVFFYLLIFIIVHDAVQDYVVDKCIRKLSLSKVKVSKFTESAHLVLFTLAFTAWSANLAYNLRLLPDVQHLWTGYPHAPIEWQTKLFFLLQVSYWLHHLPELYIRKVKMDEWPQRITYVLLYVMGISGAYFLSHTPLAILLLFLHYSAESIFHISRLSYLTSKKSLANVGFTLWKIWFVLSRLITLMLSIVVFWFGLTQFSEETVNLEKSNFNTPLLRLLSLVFVIGTQAWLMWLYVTFEIRYRRDKTQVQQQLKKAKMTKEKLTKEELKKPANGMTQRKGAANRGD